MKNVVKVTIKGLIISAGALLGAALLKPIADEASSVILNEEKDDDEI